MCARLGIKRLLKGTDEDVGGTLTTRGRSDLPMTSRLDELLRCNLTESSSFVQSVWFDAALAKVSWLNSGSPSALPLVQTDESVMMFLALRSRWSDPVGDAGPIT